MDQLDQLDYEYFQDEEYEEVGYQMEMDTPKYKIQRIPTFRISRGQEYQKMPLVREVMLAASSASQQPTASYNIKDRSPPGTAICAVCGDGQAKLHYGVLACYGCKGFFRRTLAGKYRYVCRFGNNCTVDKYQRNSCRYCRFQRCIEVGMDPKAVRPDRDLTGKQRTPRMRKKQIDEELLNHMMRLQGDDWSRKLPVDVRILLMQLMQIEAQVVKGDDNQVSTSQIMRDQKNISLREMFEQRPAIDGRRTEMRYEPFRMAKTEELSEIAHRRALAAVDWVSKLTEYADVEMTEDKVALTKACYAPLTIFNFSARTAQNTKNPDILCLCSHSYVPRQLPPEFNETNHLSNVLIDRTLNELVAPLRKLNLREEEIVPLKAIIILNPNTKGLSQQAKVAVSNFRDKVQDMLFQIVKELHPVYSTSSSSRFGNLLLLLPTITTLSSLMSENMQFCQAFGGRQSGDPLLAEMFGDFKFNIDDSQISSSVSPPLFENPADITLHSISPPLLDSPGSYSRKQKSDIGTQTEENSFIVNSRSSNSLISGGCSPPMNTSISSPFDSLLDPGHFPSQDLSLVDLGCEDLFFRCP